MGAILGKFPDRAGREGWGVAQGSVPHVLTRRWTAGTSIILAAEHGKAVMRLRVEERSQWRSRRSCFQHQNTWPQGSWELWPELHEGYNGVAGQELASMAMPTVLQLVHVQLSISGVLKMRYQIEAKLGPSESRTYEPIRKRDSERAARNPISNARCR